MFSKHRKLDRRQHRKRTWLPTQRCAGAEREVSSRRTAGGHGHFHRFLGAGRAPFMPGHDSVLAGRHALDSEAAILATDREERMLEHANVRFHPWMLVA